ncbi:MAG: hypothetical protein H5T92_02840 [Synergistales bacterium]|nr:hypothetical protein [Synergistales bacterium]
MKALKGSTVTGLDNKMRTVLIFIRDNAEAAVLSDPGNPSNNVAETVDAADKQYLAKFAEKCLYFLEEEEREDPDMVSAWQRVFREERSTGESAVSGKRFVVTQDKRPHVDRTYA